MRLSQILIFCVAEVVLVREETYRFKVIVKHDRNSLCISNKFEQCTFALMCDFSLQLKNCLPNWQSLKCTYFLQIRHKLKTLFNFNFLAFIVATNKYQNLQLLEEFRFRGKSLYDLSMFRIFEII